MDLRKLQTDPAEFREAILVDTDDGPKRFGSVVDDWQEADFLAIDPALRRVVGQDIQAQQRAWLERPRGHSKTCDIAVSATWLLFASRRKLSGVCCASDRDQAALIREAIDRLLRCNPWLAELLEVKANRIRNRHTGSTLEIISSDVASSYGLLADFVICDELTHWAKRDLWDSVFSTAAKRKHCLLLVISNAGFRESWQWQLREAIRNDPAWIFSRLDGPVASWISQERLAEQQRLLPRKVYERLWLNQWSDNSGDALELDDLESAICLKRQPNGLEKGWIAVAGLDIGLSRDHSALSVVAKHVGYTERIAKPKRRRYGTNAALEDLGFLESAKQEAEYKHRPGTGKVRLMAVRTWKPDGSKVELEAVEKEITALRQQFMLQSVHFDPWQAEYLAERLGKQHIRTEACHFTAANLQEMAVSVLDAFREKRLELFPHEQLISDLKKLRIVEKSYGYRLVSPRTSFEGHGDVATSLAIALRAARQIRMQSVLTSDRQLVLFGG